ncbi:MAG: hypothetical protein AAGJ82_15055 [Bacteroidota bacterium]
MNTHHLLDHPPQKVRPRRRLWYRIDLVINCLFILAISLALLCALFEPSFIWLAAVLLMPLGLYQFVSTIIGAAHNEAAKTYYLITIFVYFGLVGLYTSTHLYLVGPLVFVLPPLGACYYTYLSYCTYHKHKD